MKRPPREPRKIEFKVQSFREGKEGREREGGKEREEGNWGAEPRAVGKERKKKVGEGICSGRKERGSKAQGIRVKKRDPLRIS